MGQVPQKQEAMTKLKTGSKEIEELNAQALDEAQEFLTQKRARIEKVKSLLGKLRRKS